MRAVARHDGNAAKTLASLNRDDASLLPPPADPARVAALLDSPEALARAAIDLVEHAGIVTSRVATGERVIEPSEAAVDDEDEPAVWNPVFVFGAGRKLTTAHSLEGCLLKY